MTDEQRAALTRIERQVESMRQEIRDLIAEVTETLEVARQGVDGGEVTA